MINNFNMPDILDLFNGKETLVRKRTVNFVEKIFDYLKYDFRHDTLKGVLYSEDGYVTKLEMKFKMTYDSFLYLIFNRKNQLSVYILNTFFQILLNHKMDETLALKICNRFYFLYDETPIDKAILFSLFVYNELKMLDYEDLLIITLIMFNYCLVSSNIPCVQFYKIDIKKYFDLLEEYNNTKKINKIYDFVVELFHKQTYQDKSHYKNNFELNIKDVFSFLYSNRNEIKDKYKINNIYLYGSFAKAKNRLDSDFDFIISFNLDLLVEEKDKVKLEFSQYIYSNFFRYCDIHELSNYMMDEELIKNKKIKKIF